MAAGRRVALVAGVALVAQLMVSLDAGSPAVAAQPAAAIVTERPDAVSAMVTARAQGARVENTGAHTEFTTQFANPDGTWTLQRHSGQQRYRNAKGAWRPWI